MGQSKRRFIVLSSGGLQAALLLACVWMWSVWMKGQLVETMRHQAIAESRKTVDQLALLCEQEGPDAARIGSPAWQRIQRVLESTGGDNGSFISLVNRDTGQIVGHPELRAILMKEKDNGLPDARDLMSSNAKGSWITVAPKHAIIGREVQNSPLNVVSYRSSAEFVAAAHNILGPLRALGAWVAIITALGSGVMLSSVSNRYEQKINNVNKELEDLVDDRMHELTRTRDAIIYGLARLAESRDTDTGEHLDRIQQYSSLLAEKLRSHRPQIDDNYINKLRLASTLHDIGKVGIPDEILLKPGRLTEKERKIMQQHAVIGSQCLKEIRDRLGKDEFLDMAYNIAAGHHEHWDGSGYPNAVGGEQIPLEARIVAVADVYDALRSRRVYKDSMSHEKAVKIITAGCGSQFDPQIIEVFLKCSEEFHSLSMLSSQEPEMCLLEKIRECLADASDASEVENTLSFLRGAETDDLAKQPEPEGAPA